MINASKARAEALALPEVEEKSHFEKPDFRIRNKVFAVLHTPKKMMVVKFSLPDQSVFCSFDKDTLYPVEGGWGRQGWTCINLQRIRLGMLRDALATAWKTVAPRMLVKHYFPEDGRNP